MIWQLQPSRREGGLLLRQLFNCFWKRQAQISHLFGWCSFWFSSSQTSKNGRRLNLVWLDMESRAAWDSLASSLQWERAPGPLWKSPLGAIVQWVFWFKGVSQHVIHSTSRGLGTSSRWWQNVSCSGQTQNIFAALISSGSLNTPLLHWSTWESSKAGEKSWGTHYKITQPDSWIWITRHDVHPGVLQDLLTGWRW